ncbi:MAG: hypothetical protein IJ105_01870 [Bacilli bacterium]|nr:hypothetical protein [Bacilli bacterium]
MQIKLDNVSYKKLNKVSFDIEDKKITGIFSNDIKDLINLNYCIVNDIKNEGSIKYIPRFSKKRLGIISISNTIEMINGTVKDYLDENINDSLFDLLEINKDIINRQINTLSNTEKAKILFINILNREYETILINGILEELDITTRKKIIKIIINLKKFNNKTIIVSSTDIDIIYEFIDNLVLLINGNCLSSNNKFSIYNEKEIVNNPLVEKPFIKKIEDMVYNKSNINLGNNDTINELIKSIYREIR